MRFLRRDYAIYILIKAVKTTLIPIRFPQIAALIQSIYYFYM